MKPRRREGLLVEELWGEMVVFDPVTRTQHQLDKSSSLVFALCDGSRTPHEIEGLLTDAFPPEDRPAIAHDVRRLIDTWVGTQLLAVDPG